MTKKLPFLFGTFLFLIAIFSTNLFAQSPAKYICDKFDGELSELIEDRSFVGNTYKCDVKEQWDMMIQSKLNGMIINDKYFGDAKKWEETYVDTVNYIRRSFSFKSDEYFIVNLYDPYEKKTNHFFIAE